MDIISVKHSSFGFCYIKNKLKAHMVYVRMETIVDDKYYNILQKGDKKNEKKETYSGNNDSCNGLVTLFSKPCICKGGHKKINEQKMGSGLYEDYQKIEQRR